MVTRNTLRDLGIRLTLPLLVIGVVELLTYRLASPVLRPSGDKAPGIAHEILENLGLFGFHLSSVLTAVVLALVAVPLALSGGVRDRVLGTFAACVAVLALAMQLVSPSAGVLELALQGAYGLAIVAIVVSVVTRPGDRGARIGVSLLAVPLLIHVLGPLVLHIRGEEAFFSGMPETFTNIGHWALILAASATPYCFAPRPFVRSAMRPAPALIGAFVGLVAAIIIRKNFEAGAVLASYGLGVELGAGIPQHQVALALLALGTLTWTLVSCFLADSPARRRVGVGIALILIGGYGFTWPMQYSLGVLGLWLVARSGSEATDEEEAAAPSRGYFRPPPVAAETWQTYVKALAAGLESECGAEVSVLTSNHDGQRTTKLHTEIQDLAVRVEIGIDDESVTRIDVVVGGTGQGPPAWTLAAKPEKRLGVHPAPPRTDAPTIKTGDDPFDQRFRVRDAGGLTDRLLDEGLRARATALFDGWLAFWPQAGLGFRVCPGRGAPLDHPIPLTELAFRPAGGPIAVDRMVALLQLLAEIAGRGMNNT